MITLTKNKELYAISKIILPQARKTNDSDGEEEMASKKKKRKKKRLTKRIGKTKIILF